MRRGPGATTGRSPRRGRTARRLRRATLARGRRWRACARERRSPKARSWTRNRERARRSEETPHCRTGRARPWVSLRGITDETVPIWAKPLQNKAQQVNESHAPSRMLRLAAQELQQTPARGRFLRKIAARNALSERSCGTADRREHFRHAAPPDGICKRRG